MEHQIIRIKCVLLGDANAGKTSLVSRYVNGDFHSKTQTTVGCAFKNKTLVKKKWDVRLDIWDTAGQEKYRSLLPMYYKDAKVVLLCLDLSEENPNLESDIQYWMDQLDNNCNVDDREIFFVGTKCDIKIDTISNKIENIRKKYNNTIYIETSAKENQNIQHLFDYCIEKVIDKVYVPETSAGNFVLSDTDKAESACFKCSIS